MNAPLLSTCQQSGMLEHAQVPRDGGQRNIERRRQVTGRRFSMGELLQDTAANGVRQGSEGGVERPGHILNHYVKYKPPLVRMSSLMPTTR